MAENKNVELNDEMMADAAGGKRASGDKKFFVGDRVAWSWDNGTDCGTSFGTIVEADANYFSYRVLVDPNCHDGGKIVNKHGRNLEPVDM